MLSNRANNSPVYRPSLYRPSPEEDPFHGIPTPADVIRVLGTCQIAAQLAFFLLCSAQTTVTAAHRQGGGAGEARALSALRHSGLLHYKRAKTLLVTLR